MGDSSHMTWLESDSSRKFKDLWLAWLNKENDLTWLDLDLRSGDLRLDLTWLVVLEKYCLPPQKNFVSSHKSIAVL